MARTSCRSAATGKPLARRMRRLPKSGAAFDSSPLPEELAQQLCRLGLAHTRIDFGPVQALHLFEHARAMFDRAALGIGRGVIETGNACMADRARAHRTGFERDVEIAFAQP